MVTPAGRHPLLEAKVHFVLKGKSYVDFARFHRTSENWVSQVMSGRVSAPKRFRSDLAAFLQIPEQVLFPQYVERDDVEVAR